MRIRKEIARFIKTTRGEIERGRADYPHAEERNKAFLINQRQTSETQKRIDAVRQTIRRTRQQGKP